MNRTGWRAPYRRRLTQAAAVAALLTLPALGPVDTPEPLPSPVEMPTPDLSSPAGTAPTLP